jgi:hypothetical protein|tara:strand:+ start:2060 stop:2167 length:108 start_codon:yes stop_codon:yes gene_type:complete
MKKSELKKLIKEVLSKKTKAKKCGCGGNCCKQTNI